MPVIAAQHDTPPPTTLAERDAAQYIGYSPAYLRKCRRTGHGPAYIRVGRSIRYRIKDLDAWLEAHRVTTQDGRR